MVCLVLQVMVHNVGCQLPLFLVLQSHNSGVQVSHQEDIHLRKSARKGLLHPQHHQLFIGRYLLPHYVPTLPPHRQHKTYHVWAVVFHPLEILYFLLPPRDDDSAPMRIRNIHAPLHVYPLCILRLLEDADPHIAHM